MVRFLCALLALCIPLAAWGANPTTTRRVVLEKSDHGYRWKLTEAAVPPLGEHQVLIRVRAVALNRGDLEILDADGGPDHQRTRGGLRCGRRCGGGRQGRHRAAAGSRVTSTYFQNWTDGPPTQEKLGKALGASSTASWRTSSVLDDTNVAPAPAGLSYEEASTLPTAGLTGWMASVGRREPHRGDVVLIQGTGGVSVFAMQFAAAAGARIILTSSSDAKIAARAGHRATRSASTTERPGMEQARSSN